MQQPTELDINGNFKYIEIVGNDSQKRKFIVELKRIAISNYTSDYQKTLLPLLFDKLNQFVKSTYIPTNLILSILMPPVKPGKFKDFTPLETGLNNIEFDIPINLKNE